jgi:hypothetical protein
MTKKELIEKLKFYPDDTEIYISADYEGQYCIMTAYGKLDRLGRCSNGDKYNLCLFAEPLENADN